MEIKHFTLRFEDLVLSANTWSSIAPHSCTDHSRKRTLDMLSVRPFLAHEQALAEPGPMVGM